MSLTALAFLTVFSFFAILSFASGPIWAVLNYLFVYLISPNPLINWWAADIPNLRWSLISAFVLLLSMFLHKTKLAEHKFLDSPISMLFIIFLLLTLLLSFSAVDVSRHYERCYDLFRYFVVYFMLVKVIKTEDDFMNVLLLLVVCGFLLGYFAYTAPRSGGRLEGVGPPDAADSNNLAIIFAGILPFVLPLFFYGKNLLKGLSAAATVFIVNGIVLCNSRGGLVAIASSIVFGVILLRDKRLRRLAIIMVFFLGMTFLYLADEQFWERSQTITTSFEEDGATGRFDIWKNGLRMVADYPMGTGGGGFEYLSRDYMPPELLTTGQIRASHNTYLLILVEQGIVGLILFLLILFSLYLHLWRSYQQFNVNAAADSLVVASHNRMLKQFTVLALIVALVSQNVGALVSDRLYYEYFFILAALVTVYHPLFLFKDGRGSKSGRGFNSC